LHSYRRQQHCNDNQHHSGGFGSTMWERPHLQPFVDVRPPIQDEPRTDANEWWSLAI
jgi:hypothetical protein